LNGTLDRAVKLVNHFARRGEVLKELLSAGRKTKSLKIARIASAVAAFNPFAKDRHAGHSTNRVGQECSKAKPQLSLIKIQAEDCTLPGNRYTLLSIVVRRSMAAVILKSPHVRESATDCAVAGPRDDPQHDRPHRAGGEG